VVAGESGEAGNPGTLGMTKGRVAFPFQIFDTDGEQQVPPQRCAPVGMTVLSGNAKYSFQDELSSRVYLEMGEAALQGGNDCLGAVGHIQAHQDYAYVGFDGGLLD
jgi:hypothetical protein